MNSCCAKDISLFLLPFVELCVLDFIFCSSILFDNNSSLVRSPRRQPSSNVGMESEHSAELFQHYIINIKISELFGCDPFGPKRIWSSDIWSPTMGPQLIGPSGQTVPNQFGPHGQMVPKNLVPMDKWSTTNLVPQYK